jgi:hypothetical protein
MSIRILDGRSILILETIRDGLDCMKIHDLDCPNCPLGNEPRKYGGLRDCADKVNAMKMAKRILDDPETILKKE